MVDSKGEIEDEYERLGAIMSIKGGSKSVRWSDPMSCELRGSFQAWKDGVWPCLAGARERIRRSFETNLDILQIS